MVPDRSFTMPSAALILRCEPDTHTLVQWQNAVQMSRFVNIRRRQQLMYNVALGL